MEVAAGQALDFLVMLLTGIILGLIFDVYRVMRNVYRFRLIVTWIGDLLYWLLATILVFAALIYNSWGELRLYVFIGLAAGVGLYYRFFSRAAAKVIFRVFCGVNKTIRLVNLAIYYLILKPLGVIFTVLLFPFSYCCKVIAGIRRKWSKPPNQGFDPPA